METTAINKIFGSWEDLKECKNIEDLSNYVDHICYENCNDCDFNIKQLNLFNLDEIEYLNPTSYEKSLLNSSMSVPNHYFGYIDPRKRYILNQDLLYRNGRSWN